MRKFLVLALATGLAGCSAASPTLPPLQTVQPASVTAASLTAMPSSAASPTVSLADLAAQYTAIANTGNAKIDQCNKDVTAAGNDLAKATAAAGECLSALNAFESALGAVRWGPVQPQVDDVIKAMGTVQVLYGQMAKATDASSYMAAGSQLATAEGALVGAVNVLRSALGLPPSQ